MKTYLVLTERKRVHRKLIISIWELTNDAENPIKLINNSIVVNRFVAGRSTESKAFLKQEIKKYIPETEFNVVLIQSTDLTYFDNFKI